MRRITSPQWVIVIGLAALCTGIVLSSDTELGQFSELGTNATVHWNADGSLLAITGRRAGAADRGLVVEIYDPVADAIINTFNSGDVQAAVAWNPIERDVLAITYSYSYPSTLVRILNAVDGTLQAEFASSVLTYTDAISWSPDGELIAKGTGASFPTSTSGIEIFDRQGAVVRQFLKGPRQTTAVEWSPAGETIALEIFGDDIWTVSVIDAETGETLHYFDVDSWIDPIGGGTLYDWWNLGGWSSSGDRLIIHDGSMLLIYDTSDYSLLFQGNVVAGSIRSIEWGAATGQVAVMSDGGEVVIFDPDDPDLRATIDFSPRRFGTASMDWNPVTGQIAIFDDGLYLVDPPALTRVPTPTPIVTLSPQQNVTNAAILRDLLVNPECANPCVFGIEVNVTTRNDIRAMLDASGVELSSYTGQVNQSPEWSWYVDDMNVSVSFVEGDLRGVMSVSFTDDVVTQIRVPVVLPLDSVLAAFGNPETVWYGQGSDPLYDSEYVIAYPSRRVAFSIYYRVLQSWRVVGVYLVAEAAMTDTLTQWYTPPRILDEPCAVFDGMPPCILPTATPIP